MKLYRFRTKHIYRDIIMYKLLVPSHTSSHKNNHKVVLQLVMASHTVCIFMKWHIQEVDI